MAFCSNAHTHSTFSDGKSTLKQQLDQAAKLGFQSIGLSDHAMQGHDWDASMHAEIQDAYFAAIAQAVQDPAYQGMKIWAGLELDMQSDENCRSAAHRQAQYLIGSTHYLLSRMTGEYVAVDGGFDRLRALRDEEFSGDGVALAKAYFQQDVELLLREKPQIIGHFDLVCKHAPKGLFSTQDKAYRKAALDALEQAFACGGILEVNTGGMARYGLPTPYPSEELLNAWREMGGRVTITSDCHMHEYLNFAFDRAEELLRRCGFRTAERLGTGTELFETVSLES